MCSSCAHRMKTFARFRRNSFRDGPRLAAETKSRCHAASVEVPRRVCRFANACTTRSCGCILSKISLTWPLFETPYFRHVQTDSAENSSPNPESSKSIRGQTLLTSGRAPSAATSLPGDGGLPHPLSFDNSRRSWFSRSSWATLSWHLANFWACWTIRRYSAAASAITASSSSGCQGLLK